LAIQCQQMKRDNITEPCIVCRKEKATVADGRYCIECYKEKMTSDQIIRSILKKDEDDNYCVKCGHYEAIPYSNTKCDCDCHSSTK